MSSDAFTFIVRISGRDPERHELDGETKTLGRGPENDIQVLVAEVSVKHATLEPTENGYKIIDQGSTNGVEVNGQRVGEGGTPLAGKEKLLLGDTVPAYFVASSELESNSVDEVIESIDGAAQAPETAPVAAAAQPAPAAPAQPASDGATTVKLDQVQPPAPGGGAAKPPPAAPAAPGGAKPPPAQPSQPPKPAKGGGQAPQPPQPGGGQPVAPTPLKKPEEEGEQGQEGGAPKPPPPPKPDQ